MKARWIAANVANDSRCKCAKKMPGSLLKGFPASGRFAVGKGFAPISISHVTDQPRSPSMFRLGLVIVKSGSVDECEYCNQTQQSRRPLASPAALPYRRQPLGIRGPAVKRYAWPGAAHVTGNTETRFCPLARPQKQQSRRGGQPRRPCHVPIGAVVSDGIVVRDDRLEKPL